MSELDALKRAPASTGILDVIASRWSPRAFSPQAPSAQDLETILTAASWAASSGNGQPWRFLVGRSGDPTFAKILSVLTPHNQDWAKHAPVLLLSAGKKVFSPGPFEGQPNGYALHDTGAASAYMSLQATVLGMHTHGMGGFDREKARALFNIPPVYDLGACWALGYAASPDTLTDPLKQRELAPRTRKPLSDFVFSSWETPAEL